MFFFIVYLVMLDSDLYRFVNRNGNGILGISLKDPPRSGWAQNHFVNKITRDLFYRVKLIIFGENDYF